MTTEHPYTDDDLRAEAGLALSALVHLPTVDEITTSLRSSYVPHLHADGDEATWGDLLDQDGLTEAARQIHELMIPAAPVGEWAVNLGADNLQPSTEHEITLNAGRPIARIHFAFEPDMPEEMRTDLVQGIGDAINEAGAEREDDEPADSDAAVFDLISEIASKLRDATDSGEYHAVGLIYDLAMSRTTVAEARAELADIEFGHV
ncbi:hypothetical protein GCM10022384_07660 [Streptomyces marokkonensis]|uniref:Uncharacterized protein n=1 Tax=Streptomyces marokkonensis TaxID=324855 RepID=A0ABP7NZA3_9ACTN